MTSRTLVAGKRNRRITIDALVVENNPDYGPQPAGWAVVARNIYANVQDALPSKSESVEHGMAMAANRTRIRFRYRPGITSAMRITVHGADERVLQIVGGPATLGNREGIEVMCESYSTQGGV